MLAATGPNCNRSAGEEFDRLVERHQTALLRLCMVYLRDGELAKDAVQETYLKAYQALPHFRGECGEKTWLTRIAVNVCRDMARSAYFRHTDRRVTPEEMPDRPGEEAPPEREALAQALLELPRRYKDAVLLYYYQDLSQEEVGKALGLSAATVSRRLERARRMLKTALKGKWENE
jgi:RNA polymerase sigma-70 factor (ECF subfamily)